MRKQRLTEDLLLVQEEILEKYHRVAEIFTKNEDLNSMPREEFVEMVSSLMAFFVAFGKAKRLIEERDITQDNIKSMKKYNVNRNKKSSK